jgi:hypothetical protein
VSSILCQEPLLDEAIMKDLNNSSSLLCQTLMSQPADISGLEIDIPDDIFGVKGKIIMAVPDIIDDFKDGWLNISILKIACL